MSYPLSSGEELNFPNFCETLDVDTQHKKTQAKYKREWHHKNFIAAVTGTVLQC